MNINPISDARVRLVMVGDEPVTIEVAGLVFSRPLSESYVSGPLSIFDVRLDPNQGLVMEAGGTDDAKIPALSYSPSQYQAAWVKLGEILQSIIIQHQVLMSNIQSKEGTEKDKAQKVMKLFLAKLKSMGIAFDKRGTQYTIRSGAWELSAVRHAPAVQSPGLANMTLATDPASAANEIKHLIKTNRIQPLYDSIKWNKVIRSQVFYLHARDKEDKPSKRALITFGYDFPHVDTEGMKPVFVNFDPEKLEKSQVRAAQPTDFPFEFLAWAYVKQNAGTDEIVLRDVEKYWDLCKSRGWFRKLADGKMMNTGGMPLEERSKKIDMLDRYLAQVAKPALAAQAKHQNMLVAHAQKQEKLAQIEAEKARLESEKLTVNEPAAEKDRLVLLKRVPWDQVVAHYPLLAELPIVRSESDIHRWIAFTPDPVKIYPGDHDDPTTAKLDRDGSFESEDIPEKIRIFAYQLTKTGVDPEGVKGKRDWRINRYMIPDADRKYAAEVLAHLDLSATKVKQIKKIRKNAKGAQNESAEVRVVSIGDQPITVEFAGCVWTNSSLNHSEGDLYEVTVQVPLNAVLDESWNTKSLVTLLSESEGDSLNLADLPKTLEKIDQVLSWYRAHVKAGKLARLNRTTSKLNLSGIDKPTFPDLGKEHWPEIHDGGDRVHVKIPGWKITGLHKGLGEEEAPETGPGWIDEDDYQIFMRNPRRGLNATNRDARPDSIMPDEEYWTKKDYDKLANQINKRGQLKNWWDRIDWEVVNTAYSKGDSNPYRRYSWYIPLPEETLGRNKFTESNRFLVFGFWTPSRGPQAKPIILDYNPDVPEKDRVREARPADVPLYLMIWAGLVSNMRSAESEPQYRKLIKSFEREVTEQMAHSKNAFNDLLDKYYAEIDPAKAEELELRQKQKTSLRQDPKIQVLNPDLRDGKTPTVPHPAKMSEKELSDLFDTLDKSKMWKHVLPKAIDGTPKAFTNGFDIKQMRNGQVLHNQYVIWGGILSNRPQVLNVQQRKLAPATPKHFPDKLLWHLAHTVNDEKYDHHEDPVFEGDLLGDWRMNSDQRALVNKTLELMHLNGDI